MEDGPLDTTGRLRQVTRRQFTAAAGLGLTAAGASFAAVGCASGTSTTPAVATRPAPSAVPPEGPLLDPFTGEPVSRVAPYNLYTLPDGQRMLFAPGQTWVVLAPDNHASHLNAARV